MKAKLRWKKGNSKHPTSWTHYDPEEIPGDHPPDKVEPDNWKDIRNVETVDICFTNICYDPSFITNSLPVLASSKAQKD